MSSLNQDPKMSPHTETTSDYDSDLDDSTPLLSNPSTPNQSSIDDPRDPYNVVYIIFLLLGLAGLLPYNMCINASGYFEYKLRNVNDTSIETPLQQQFESYFTAFSTGAVLIMTFGNTMLVRYIGHTKRLVYSLLLVIVFLIPTIALIKVNTDDWQSTFFVLTILNIVALNLCSSVLQGGSFGVAGMLPSVYTQAVMSGQAVAGVFSSLLEIFTLALFDDQEKSAFLYFVLAEVLLLVTLIACISLDKLPFYIYHTHKNDSLASPSERTAKGSIFKETFLVFKKTFVYGFSVAYVFFVTLAIFPNYIDSIEPPKKFQNNKFWFPVTCFLLFNVGDLIGRVLAGIIGIPRKKYSLVVLSCLRTVFLVLFIFCNYEPRKHDLDVWFGSDYWAVVFTGLLALTNGYVGSLCMMFGSNMVTDPAMQEQAGTVLAFFMALGLSLGAAFSFVFITIP
jgi:equilibrative nucleoside transporter 1/2/3